MTDSYGPEEPAIPDPAARNDAAEHAPPNTPQPGTLGPSPAARLKAG